MEFTGEQCVIGETTSRIQEDHLNRYRFVKKYVKNKVVLDLACGTGYGSRMIKDFSAKKIYGMDISEEAIIYAKNNYATEGLEFIQGNVTRLPFNDSFFDTIVSFETIEHLNLNERDNFLKELYRVLKKDGHLIMSTPNRKITSPLSKKPHNPYHVIEYSISEIKKIITNYKFRNIEILGQRMINIILVPYIIRRFAGAIQVIIGKNLSLYHIANGPAVTKVSFFYTPRYIILVNKK